MGFLERISGVVLNLKTNSKIRGNKIFFGPGFSTNSLKRTKLTNDVFQSEAAVAQKALLPNAKTVAAPIITNDEQLALEQPLKFIDKYCTSDVFNNAIRVNPAIKKILSDNNLSINYNLDNIHSIKHSHLIPCSKVAQNIYTNMGYLKNSPDYIELTQAALLHDFGKAFIPSSILNKKGRLNARERKIVELHNKLSYEILKTTGLNPRVAQLANEHHNYDGTLVKNHLNQALTISDIYCALREDRPYKKPINDFAAKAILYDMGVQDKIDTRYINCINLKK